MKDIRIQAKSSSGPPHEVWFKNHGDSFTVFCNCQAGKYGKLCHHKTRFLLGDASMLHDPGEAPVLAELRSWMDGSECGALLTEYEVLKEKADDAKRKEQDSRVLLEITMKAGIRLKGKS